MAGDGGDRAEIGRPRRLVDWPWVAVEVECSLCRRTGRYRLARLAERHGAEIALGALLLALAGRCCLSKPGIKPRQYEARCGARYRVPAGGPLPDGAPAREAVPGETWPPRLKRLGPEGPLPTVGDTRREGVTHVSLHCYGLNRDRVTCHNTARIALDALGLPDDAVFIHIPRLRQFRCRKCGGREPSVMPCWPRQDREKRTADGRLIMPGTVPEPRTPGPGEAPTGR